jgi:Domain of unknown function (DUF4192)
VPERRPDVITLRPATCRQSILSGMTKTTGAGDQSPQNKDETRKVRFSAGSPEAVLAVVPHLLGFYPERSLVVIGLGGQPSQVRVTFRYDLPWPLDAMELAGIAEHAASVLRRQETRAAVLIGYGTEAATVPVLEAVMRTLSVSGVSLGEVLRADGGRYWSLLCASPDCCPAEGRPYDPGSHPVAAAMTQAGHGALPDRAALARTLQPPPGTAERVRLATDAAQRQLSELVARGQETGERDPRLRVARTGRAVVQRAIRSYRAGGAITAGDQLAWVAVLLADLRVRDDAWARMDPAHFEAHNRLWTDVLRAAATEYIPAPASLLAFTAWQAGNGALAACAVDRALAADPDYSMALLIGEALQAGLPPSSARLPMRPAQVAASYAAWTGGRSASRGRSPRRKGRKRRRGPTARAGGPPDTAGPRQAAPQAAR